MKKFNDEFPKLAGKMNALKVKIGGGGVDPTPGSGGKEFDSLRQAVNILWMFNTLADIAMSDTFLDDASSFLQFIADTNGRAYYSSSGFGCSLDATDDQSVHMRRQTQFCLNVRAQKRAYIPRSTYIHSVSHNEIISPLVVNSDGKYEVNIIEQLELLFRMLEASSGSYELLTGTSAAVTSVRGMLSSAAFCNQSVDVCHRVIGHFLEGVFYPLICGAAK